MSNTVAKIIAYDNFLEDTFGVNDIDERFKVIVSDQTIYDNTSATHARGNFNYSLLKIKKPAQSTYSYGNVGDYDNFRYPPSLIPEDLVIEKPLMGIYEFTLYIVPDAVSGENYLTDECVRFNGLMYKFTANSAFAGVLLTTMTLIDIDELTANYKSTKEFCSVIPLIQCFELKSGSLYCKLKENFHHEICKDKEFSDIMILFAPGIEFSTIEITDENREKFRDIFNYLSLACSCPTC